MNFWCTSEATTDVSRVFFSNPERVGAMKAYEDAINRHLDKVETGDWKQWCVIFMIFDQFLFSAMNWHETRRLTRKDMTLDFRVFVAHEPAKTADFCQCVDLLVPALERTLPYFSKAKIDRNTQETIRGIIHLAAEETKASASTLQ
jgi:hypothetical protein